MDGRKYLCIDLKSFYASVECVERGLDPMTTNLVVADPGRSDKTICLAVSPSMKALGVRNRCRVFEIPPGIDYIMAVPRMQKYIDYAAEIYGIYLRYISKDDIHVYSIDEAFLDVTGYLGPYDMDARGMAVMLMDRVYSEVGVRAACGIGTNLYLAKIALDITAKHSPDFIGELDEEKFIETLWDHEPITDFWRIGRGTARSLAELGIRNMRGIAELAERDEGFLYDRYGIDAELMIDHAYGREPVTMADIKKFKPKSTSMNIGQVLMRDYRVDEARLVLREMVETMCLDLVKKDLATSSITMYIRFAKSTARRARQDDLKVRDYGPNLKLFGTGGTASVGRATNAIRRIVGPVLAVYDEIVPPDQEIRGINISCNTIPVHGASEQLTILDVMDDTDGDDEKDLAIQRSMIAIKERFGKNAVFKAMDLEEGATQLERNMQIGGHKSGEE